MERNNLCTGNGYCISKNKVNTTRTSFMKQVIIILFPFKSAIPSLLVTFNFSKRKSKTYQAENQIWYLTILTLLLYGIALPVVKSMHCREY